MLTFAVALRDKGVPVPEIAKKLTIRAGKNEGRHPSVASLYRALAEAEAAAAGDRLPLRPELVHIRRPGEPLTAEEIDLRDRLQSRTTVTVRLGDPPSPLPEPVADLMRAYVQSCRHQPYASSRSSRWLFPGRQPGQPMNPVSLQVHLREIGVPPQRGRTSAIRQLVLQAPAPVIAKALGYHDKTATRLVTEAGGTWSRYAPGDHTQ